MLAKISIQSLAVINSLHLKVLLASSLRAQRGYLLASRAMLATGNIKAARMMLWKWKIENRSYKTVLNMHGV